MTALLLLKSLNLFITFPLCVLSSFWVYLVFRSFRQKSTRPATVAPYTGTVAILIPCFNEAANIELCLRALLSSRFPLSQMKIYLSDDGSTDASLTIARSVFDEYPNCAHTILQREHVGKAVGMRMTLEEVTEEICILLDADTFVTEDALRALVNPYTDQDIEAVSSCVLLWNPSRWLEIFQSVEYCCSMLLQKVVYARFGCAMYISGQIFSIRRSSIARIGGMPVGLLTEDYEMYLRLVLDGRKVHWSQDALVYTVGCDTIGSLLAQRMRWWFGAVDCLAANRRQVYSTLLNPTAPNGALIRLMTFDRFACFWFVLLVYPTTAFLFHHFLPVGTTVLDILVNAFFWFSIVGIFRVLYKLPEWGIDYFTFFGVLSGLNFMILNVCGLQYFRHLSLKRLLVVMFLFPYFLVIMLAIPLSLIRYRKQGSRKFID